MPAAAMTMPTLGHDSSTTMLPRAEPAGNGLIVVAATLAAAEVILAVMVVVIVTIAGGVGAGTAAAALAVALLAADFAWWVRSGQGLSGRVAGIMWLTRVDDAPVGFARLVPLPATWVAATRGRRDPIDVRLAPMMLADVETTHPYASPSSGASTAQSATASAPSRAARRKAAARSDRPHGGAVRVTVNGQSHHVLAGVAVVGRRPLAEVTGEAIITVADLGRTLSKNHLRLEVEHDGSLWVTDLGSTNGSTIERTDGGRTELVPHKPAVVELRDSVTLGDHTLTFSQGGGA